MRTVTIPTVFTAVDKFSSPVTRMGASMAAFSTKAEAGIARSERMFRRLTPVVSETQKQFLSFASSAAIAGGVFAGAAFSVDAIKQYEDALASFHTIVGDDKPFKIYQDEILKVAQATGKSTIDTAAAFEKIAGLNSTFAETAEGIGAVSTAAITLAKASGDELGTSAESLVGIMNQFGFAATEANRTINVLAAGAGVGAANITQTAESFVNFGSVAKGANITLEQSVGLIQTLGKFTVLGAEAGTKLRGSILKLQQAGIGYKSGQFQINDALEEAKKKIDKLKTAKQQDAAVLKMFGAENIATGKTLLNNIDLFKKYTEGVSAVNAAGEQTAAATAAQDQAAIRSKTLSATLDELKAAWVNMLTGSEAANEGLTDVKKVIAFVTKNLGTIVSVGAKVVAVFAAWKAIMIASKIALAAYNIVLGINSALQGESAFVTYGNTVAYNAYRATVLTTTPALAAMTSAQASLNAVMLANPIGAFIVLMGALVIAITAAVNAYLELEKVERRRFEQKQAKKQESFSIQDRVAANYAKGNSLPESKRLALEESKKSTLAQIKEQRALLNNPTTAAAAEEKLNSLYGKASAVLSGKALTESGPRYANTKELGSYVAPIAGGAGNKNTAAPDWLNMPKQQVELTINAPAGTLEDAKTTKGNVSIIPKISSTMKGRRE